jgi:hypothetical protein
VGETYTEAQAIAALRRLARRWPSRLKLISWSGALVVIDKDLNERLIGERDGAISERAVVAQITGIPNDGGDPDSVP